MSGQRAECPACGGPGQTAPRTGPLLWHREWHVGPGGRVHQRGTVMCTSRADEPEVPRVAA